MFRFFVFFIFCLSSIHAFGQGTLSQYTAYLVSNGYTTDQVTQLLIRRGVELLYQGNDLWIYTKWDLGTPPPQELPSIGESSVILAEAAIAEAAARQASKPLEQRQYENAFFALTEQVLTLSSDPRVGQIPPVKLGFDELNALLESLFDSDMATATKLSIKLLSIDSALKRYNILWWDDAITHEIPEE